MFTKTDYSFNHFQNISLKKLRQDSEQYNFTYNKLNIPKKIVIKQ